jgi:hypothetical protein
MKSHLPSFRPTLALGLILSLTFNPLYVTQAQASQKADYSQVCDPIDNNATAANGASNGGDQAKAECAKAKMSMNATKVEKTKTIVFGTAAAICTAMAVIENLPWSAAAAKVACNIISTGVSMSGMVMDKEGVSSNGEIVGKFAATSSQVMSMAGSASGLLGGASGLFGSYISSQAAKASGQVVGAAFSKGMSEGMKQTGSVMGGVANGAKEASSEATKKAAEEASKKAADQAAKKVACISSAVMLGIQTGLSVAGMAGASKTFQNSLFNAKSIKASALDSTTKIALQGNNINNGPVSGNPKPGAASTKTGVETCDDKGGNEYISCMGQASPELSAISNNPDFLGTMEKALGGKSLGDFAKGFNGNTQQDAANYIGAGLGMNPSAIAKLMDAQSKLAQDAGATEKYEPMAYTRAGGAAQVSDHAPDFNAMMAGMLKQLNPDADAKKDDAAELVFRQLDLLPPEKIEQSKDISLFARIGYRYRKNASNLEQLNWSRPENQQNATK